MRFGYSLLAVMVLANSADGQMYVHSALPEGGVELVQPGFTMRTPGKGWEIYSWLQPHDGMLTGSANWLGWTFKRSDGRGEIFVDVVRWSLGIADPTDLDGFVRRTDTPGAGAPVIPSERFTVQSTTVNGAPCVVSRTVLEKRLVENGPLVTGISVHQVCRHPEFPGFAVQVRYQFDGTDGEAELVAVAQSLRFKPLPYRVREIVPSCVVAGFAETGNAAWFICRRWQGDYTTGGTVVRIDPATNAIVARIPAEPLATYIGTAFGAVWVHTGDALWRIDPKTNAVTDKIKMSGTVWSITAAGNYIWVQYMDRDAHWYLRIDPVTDRIDKRHRLKDLASEVTTDDGIFFLEQTSDVIRRIDPVSGRVTRHAKIGETTQLRRYDGRYIWMAGLDRNKPVLLRFDPKAPDVPPEIAKRTPEYLQDWLEWNGAQCGIGDQSVLCFPGGNTYSLPLEVPLNSVFARRLHVFGGSLWVEDSQGHSILRIDPK